MMDNEDEDEDRKLWPPLLRKAFSRRLIPTPDSRVTTDDELDEEAPGDFRKTEEMEIELDRRKPDGETTKREPEDPQNALVLRNPENDQQISAVLSGLELSTPSVPSLPFVAQANQVHYGNVIMEYPLHQAKQLEQENNDKIIKEVGLKLKNKYRSWHLPALPWMRDVRFPLDSYYVDLQMHPKDNVGRPENYSIELEDIFEADDEVPYRILVEGNPGYGKSMLCFKLAFEWARGAEYLTHFRLVFLIQLRYLDCDLETVLLEESSLKGRNEEEIREALLSRADDVLLLLDGCDELPRRSRNQVRNLFIQSLFPTMTVMMTTRLNFDFAHGLSSNCQKRFIIKGLNREQQKMFLQKYLVESGKQQQTIVTTIEAPETKELFQCPLLFILLCFLVTETDVEPMTKASVLYTKMFDYMIRNSKYRGDDEVVDLFSEDRTRRKPKDVAGLLISFGKLAQSSLAADKLVFSESDILGACGDLSIVDLGFLNRSVKTSFLRVTEFFEPVHKTFLEFLYAYYIEELSYSDVTTFTKVVRNTFDEIPSSSQVFAFLIGLLRDRADLFFSNLPSYQLCTWENAFPDLMEEASLTPSVLSSISKHAPRLLEFSCDIRPPHFLIRPLDFIKNVRILNFYKVLREEIPSSEDRLVLRFYVDVDLWYEENKAAEERRKLDPLEPNVRDLSLYGQHAASSMFSYENDRGMHRLHDYKCDVVEVRDFAVFLEKNKMCIYYITMAALIQQLQPQTLRLFGLTWTVKSGLEIMLDTLASRDFTLTSFILDNHEISSDEEAAFIANPLYRMKVTELKIRSFHHHSADLDSLVPLCKILLTQPVTFLRSLHFEFDDVIIEMSQESLDNLVSFVSKNPILDVFSFVLSYYYFEEPTLLIPLCKLVNHGTKNFRELRLVRVILLNSCDWDEHEISHEESIQLPFLEAISGNIPTDDTAKTIITCRSLENFRCDDPVARTLFSEAPTNWPSFQNMASFRLHVSNNVSSESWSFIQRCRRVRTLSLEFLNPMIPFIELPKVDWTQLFQNLICLEIIEFRFYFVAPNFGEFLQTFVESLEESKNLENIGTNDSPVLELGLSFLVYEPNDRRKEIKTDLYFQPFFKLLEEKIIRKLTVFVEDSFIWTCQKFFVELEKMFATNDKFSFESARHDVNSFRAIIQCRENI